MSQVLILTGPTASGKSGLALELAGKYPLEIVSADSRKVYRGLDVGTAKPDENEREPVPHHLIDIVDPGEKYSAADFVRDATSAIERIFERGKFPLVVGGTGFYLQALVGDVELEGPPELPGVREALQQLRKREGEEPWRELADRFELEVADTDNPRRLLRGLEKSERVHEHLLEQGLLEELPEFGDEPIEPLQREYRGCVLSWPREQLYERINRRAEQQFESGLIEETEWLRSLELPEDDPCVTGIGYREVGKYLDGEIRLDEALERNRQRNRNYAKRQLTWFRNQFPDWERIETDEDDFPEGPLEQLSEIIQELSGSV